MHVGFQPILQNLENINSDAEVYWREMRLADLAEPLGFDSLWAVEHHFTGYTMSPNPVQLLTHWAGRTRKLQLGTMVVVIPWNDPLRVAEELSVADIVSNGRIIFGMGRGIGRVEYDGFRLQMADSRGRFAESARMIIEALETGYIEGAGPHFVQPRAAVRPRPFKTFKGRTYAAAVSPESIPVVAKLGAGVIIIPQKPWEECEKEHNQYRQIFREVNGREAPQCITAAWTFVDEDEDRARTLGKKYLSAYYRSALEHYEFQERHMRSIPGYEYYGKIQEKIEQYGLDQFIDYFTNLQVYGTPEQCVRKIKAIQQRMNSCGYIGIFSYGEMSAEEGERNLRLFAEKVMPEVKRIETGGRPDMSYLFERQAAE